jgi:hypothetical protein
VWGIDDLMRDHEGRSPAVLKLFDESRRLSE